MRGQAAVQMETFGAPEEGKYFNMLPLLKAASLLPFSQRTLHESVLHFLIYVWFHCKQMNPYEAFNYSLVMQHSHETHHVRVIFCIMT